MSDHRYDETTGEILHTAEPETPVASAETSKVCAALVAASAKFEVPKRTQKVQAGSYSYMYAPLDEVLNAVRAPLAENGLLLHQHLAKRDGHTVMRTIVRHISGEYLGSDYPIFPTKEGHQGFASGVTYARRYGISLVLCLAPEDDDGNAADGVQAQVIPPAPRQPPRRAAQPREEAPPPPPMPEERAGPPAPRDEAPAPSREELMTQLETMRGEIEKADLKTLDLIEKSGDWQKLQDDIKRAVPTGADRTINKLLGIARERRATLNGTTNYEV